MAGGSQIIINKKGITFITPAKFEAKAGQHKFVGGGSVKLEAPILPLLQSGSLCALKTRFGKNESSEEE